MTQDQQLRDHLLYVLRGNGAHISFADLTADFPLDRINEKVPGVPYTAWQLLEHLRIAQWDILEFSRNADHVSPDFPGGYWPAAGMLASPYEWRQSIESFNAKLHELIEFVNDPALDLFARIDHGTGQTLLREALLVADHNAYHLGALALLKRVLTGEPE